MLKNIWKYQVKSKDINLDLKQIDNKASSNHSICLSELECGNSAKVIKIEGNRVLVDKLKAMGIYTGTTILKKSAIPSKGPIIVEKGAMQFAFGYDIAENIFVERL